MQKCAKKTRRAAREVTFSHPEYTTVKEANEESKSPMKEYYQTPDKNRSKISNQQQVITENLENYAHLNN